MFYREPVFVEWEMGVMGLYKYLCVCEETRALTFLLFMVLDYDSGGIYFTFS